MNNEALVRRAIEAIWNRGELEVADELFGPDYTNHGGLIPNLICGPEAIKISVALYRIAFAALHITVEELLTDGERVVIHWAARSDTPGPAHRAGIADQTLIGRNALPPGGCEIAPGTEWKSLPRSSATTAVWKSTMSSTSPR